VPKALLIIRDEHRSISAILLGMEYFVQRIRALGKKVDPHVFRAMLYYLDTFSERMHHPKEDQHLFKATRERSVEADALIADLEEEHAHGEESLRTLAQSLIRYEEGGEQEFPAFEREVENFVRNYRDHMRKEEDLLFPLAQKVLTVSDWSKIDNAFGENRDPLALGRDTQDFEKFFNHIIEIAPRPIGMGQEPRLR
jgi:hemerythrin-like domain-containing protein